MKGLILPGARCLKRNKSQVDISSGDGEYLGNHSKLFGSMERKQDNDIEEGG